MEEVFSTRKNNRLKNASYSHNGYFFITVCAKDRKQIFGKIAKPNDRLLIVGDGVLDVPKPLTDGVLDVPKPLTDGVRDGNPETRYTRFGNPYDVPKTELSNIGKITEKYITQIGNFYKDVKITKYTIMPDHIHLLLKVQKDEIDFIYPSGTSRTPSPTNHRSNEIIPRFVSTLKRFCNKEIGYNVFQRSYFDHIVRDEDDLNNVWGYIINNPAAWDYKHNDH